MQIYPHIVYGKRALFYGARVYADQLERGSDYSKLNTTICIHILGFNYFKDDDRVFRRVFFKDDETNEVYEDFRHLQFHFMELPKFHKDWTQISTSQERWAAFFKYGEKLQTGSLPPTLQSEPAFAKAVAELERIGSDPRQREIYEAREMARMIEATQIQYAEQQAERRGEQRGEQRGRLDLLTYQMTHRIGEIPADVMARMKGLSTEQLNDLAQALFDITSYDDIEAWFTRH
jgi:predicted transposase/invertase (TIGR01784 family)